MSVHRIAFELNGTRREVEVGPDRLIVDVLRDDLGVTGPKVGCSVGVCGACSILVDGVLMTGCLLPAVFVDGKKITTVEGLAPSDEELTPLQESFIRHGGFQCGICTSGQLMAATALLNEKPKPSVEDVKEFMMGNLCRCTGYRGIVKSILEAAGVEHADV